MNGTTVETFDYVIVGAGSAGLGVVRMVAASRGRVSLSTEARRRRVTGPVVVVLVGLSAALTDSIAPRNDRHRAAVASNRP